MFCMLRNYFMITWRNVAKSRFYSFANIAGLATSMEFKLLLVAFIRSEFQVNRQLRNADRQQILTSEWKNPNTGFPMATLGPLGKALKENYPDLVANYYRFDGITSNVSKGENSFRENLQV